MTQSIGKLAYTEMSHQQFFIDPLGVEYILHLYIGAINQIAAARIQNISQVAVRIYDHSIHLNLFPTGKLFLPMA